jgi:hypothetical protein
MKVWEAGYGLIGDVGGKLYVYGVAVDATTVKAL